MKCLFCFLSRKFSGVLLSSLLFFQPYSIMGILVYKYCSGSREPFEFYSIPCHIYNLSHYVCYPSGIGIKKNFPFLRNKEVKVLVAYYEQCSKNQEFDYEYLNFHFSTSGISRIQAAYHISCSFKNLNCKSFNRQKIAFQR